MGYFHKKGQGKESLWRTAWSEEESGLIPFCLRYYEWVSEDLMRLQPSDLSVTAKPFLLLATYSSLSSPTPVQKLCQLVSHPFSE